MTELTAEQKAALERARHLAENGVPLFLANPDRDRAGTWNPSGGHQSTGYWLPPRWQLSEPDSSVVDRWEPGMALCMVTGHVVDLFDVDPRSGGDDSVAQMVAAGLVPRSYGRATTPSGGTHDLIASLGARSLDKVLPGVDVKAGESTGRGRGFAFLAPTVKLSKSTGELGTYQWVVSPDVELLALLGVDETATKLAELVRSRGRGPGEGPDYGGPTYEGAAYADLSPTERRLADNYVESVTALWRDRLQEALDWSEDETDSRGRGWENLTRDWAWALAKTTAAPWTGLHTSEAEERFYDVLPAQFAATDACTGKWSAGLVAKARELPVEPPWWTDFLPVDEPTSPEDWPDIPARLDDAHLAAWMAHKGLDGCWRWAGGLGWMHWDGRVWVARREEDAREVVRREAIEVNKRALEGGADSALMKPLHGLLSIGRISSVTTLMKGVLAEDGGAFDQRPDLLNVGNGVVDLRTGRLLEHDRKYLLTKITDTPYVPGATHPDWEKALGALDPEVADWMQVRFGQAATGHPTSDDVLPIGQGGGSNGKSTILSSLFAALGGHMVQVPEKLLRAGPNDHPTEMMTLYGARVAVIDETPEVAQLNVQRLKATVGQDWITARAIRKDNVTWRATHSLFVMTNYVPSVRETDHGTWRRLALVRFTKTFPKDDRFRSRMSRGQGGRREAVLAWVVEGARRWYESDRFMPEAPERVAADTYEWRRESDLVLAYVSENLVFDPDASILATELLEDFNGWLFSRNHASWSDKTVSARFGGHEIVQRHGVEKSNTIAAQRRLRMRYSRSTADPGASRRRWVWRGVRWAQESEKEACDATE